MPKPKAKPKAPTRPPSDRGQGRKKKYPAGPVQLRTLSMPATAWQEFDRRRPPGTNSRGEALIALLNLPTGKEK